jgi:hypothetical protein
MKLYNRFILFVVMLAIVLPAYTAGGNGKFLYCWLNDDEVRECGNYVSPIYSQKGFWKCRRGGECEYINPAPTAEELEELKLKRKEERKIEEQQAKDEALLALFSREMDIKNRRTALLNSIDGQIQPIHTILEGLKGNLEDLKESYERSKDNPDVSKSQVNAIKRNVDSVEKRIIDTEDTLQNKIYEKIEINMEYDTYLQRFLEIQLRRLKLNLSPSQIAIYQEKIDEVNLGISDTLREYIVILQDNRDAPTLSPVQQTLIQNKIDKVLERFEKAIPQ